MSLRNTFYPECYHGSVLGWEKLKLLNHCHHSSLFCFLVLVWSSKYLILTTLEQIWQLGKFSQKLLEMEASLFKEPNIFISIITEKFWLWQSWYVEAWQSIHKCFPQSREVLECSYDFEFTLTVEALDLELDHTSLFDRFTDENVQHWIIFSKLGRDCLFVYHTIVC